VLHQLNFFGHEDVRRGVAVALAAQNISGRKGDWSRW